VEKMEKSVLDSKLGMKRDRPLWKSCELTGEKKTIDIQDIESNIVGKHKIAGFFEIQIVWNN